MRSHFLIKTLNVKRHREHVKKKKKNLSLLQPAWPNGPEALSYSPESQGPV